MTDVIRLLPDSLANQIAAGEVVQRPASVVKELLENSIDAKSKNITLIVKEAGKLLIQVTDDGVGMSETDARMSFERHATSKIQKSEDLFCIKTMGFRGEALASIAAVAQVEMKTRREEHKTGTHIVIEGSKLLSQEDVAMPAGATIMVKNLFYNVPARRNFLKSNAVELRHISDEFQRVALANPEVGFYFFQNDIEVYHLKPGKLGQRIVHLFGKNYQQQLVPCREEVENIKITGYIGKPEFARKTRGDQFFFVNNRFIKSSYLNHAVSQAFHGLIPESSFPFFVLFIELDPRHIDINVHPTKTEVKFDDERTIYTVLKTSVKRALGTFNLSPSMDYSVDTNFINKIAHFDLQRQNPTAHSRGTSGDFPVEKANFKNWEKLYVDAFESERMEKQAEAEAKQVPERMTFESAANKLGSEQHAEGNTPQKSANLFQLHNSYIVTSVKSGLMIIDQQLAHERILFEKFRLFIANKAGHVQQFLFPETIDLSAADYTLVKELELEIKSLGFAFEEFGKNTIALHGVPAISQSASGRELFLGVLEDYKTNTTERTEDRETNMARAMAKNAATRRNRPMSPEEMKSLIDQLFGCENPNYSPSGEKTFYILDIESIKELFN